MRPPEAPAGNGRGRGTWLAVLGPDGSGKSTLLGRLEVELEPSFAAIRRYHLRPHLGRRGSSRGPQPDPHGQPPRGRAVTVVKLTAWWVDYWLGYLLEVRPALRRSTLVLFDRYCDDVLVDPRRYRMREPGRFARLLVRTVPRPDTLVVLDAPESVLRERKQEVSVAETVRQRSAYRALADRTPRAVVIDAGRPPGEVAAEVASLVRGPRLEEASVAPHHR